MSLLMASTPKPRDPAKWDALSETQKKRYQRNGITKAKYVRGDSLSAARGHGFTPEHKLAPDKATPEQKKKYGKYLRRQTDEVWIFSTDGVMGPYPAKDLTIGEEKLIGAHWYAIKDFLSGGDILAHMKLKSFKSARRVGGRNGIPSLRLEYRLDEIEQAWQDGSLPDKPFTIGSD
jgi:hypothetical protein